MKQIKLLVCLPFLLCLANASFAQNVSINIQSQNAGQLDQGQNGFIDMQICNTSSSVTAPQNKLRPQISVPPSQLLILPDASQTLPSGWTIFSNTGSAIRFSNTTDPIEPNSCVTFQVAIQGIALGTAPVQGQIFFNGPQTSGNSATDDLSSTSVILPITLGGFEAVINDCKAKLSWHTQQEVNSLKFIVEKSINANTWNTVKEIPAAGTSAKRSDYTATDFMTESDKRIQYRLKMVDKDGRFSYSNIVNVVSTCAAKKVIVSPNPVENGQFNLFITGFANTASATLLTADGRLLINRKVTEGNNSFNVSNLPKGTYILKIADNNGNKMIQKVMVTK